MIEEIMEVFMDDFTVYGKKFDNCLANLYKVLHRCQEKDAVLNLEKWIFWSAEKWISWSAKASFSDTWCPKGELRWTKPRSK